MAKLAINAMEARRLALQRELDAAKDAGTRNRLGQFATPTGLAVSMLQFAKACLADIRDVRFFDPAIGTGSFYSALLDVFPQEYISEAVGYEIDPHYGSPASRLWSGAGLDVRLDDFTQAESPARTERFNLLICNPPYVRHHHIVKEEKWRLKLRAQNTCGAKFSGLAGLYCYYLALNHSWMSDGGLAGWLIPSEFMDVNYGVELKRYLLNSVTLIRIHRFDPNDVQFGDALVSSAVVWFRKQRPPSRHAVLFSYGGTLQQPKVQGLVSVESLCQEQKWTCYPARERRVVSGGPVLDDFFNITRGLVTGGNKYFILSSEEIKQRRLPEQAFVPILPSPRYLLDDEIDSDTIGNPMVERRLFLLNPLWKEREIMEHHSRLWNYLEEGKVQGISDRYVCRHRAPWYRQEHRPPAPFLCTYLGRSNGSGRLFRFILNHSRATAANVYLMLYPKGPMERALKDCPTLKRKVWKVLNDIQPKALLAEGRVYGGGLHKLEPRELGRVPAAAIAKLLPEDVRPLPRSLFEEWPP